MTTSRLDLPLSACRVCLKSPTQLQSIFAYTPRHRKRAQDLGAKLRQVSGLRCEPNDGLPGNICERCYVKLVQAYNFRTLCARSALSLSLSLKGNADNYQIHNGPLATNNTDNSNNGDTDNTRHSNSNQIVSAGVEKFDKCIGQDVKTELSDQSDDDFTWEQADSPFGDTENIKTEFNSKFGKTEFNNAKFHNVDKPIEAEFGDPSACKFCGLLFRGGERLELHTAQAHCDGEGQGEGFHCYGCHEAFGDRNERGKHENKCMGIDEKFFCRLCSTSLGTRRQFDAHLNTHRSTSHRNTQNHKDDPTNLACPECPFVCAKIPRYLAHRLRHRGLRPFGCNACPYRTDSRGSLARHVLMHSDVRAMACPQCPYRARYMSSLRRHILYHNTWDKVRYSPADPLAPDHRPFFCQLCFKSFRKQSRLIVHLAVCSERLSSEVQTNEKTLTLQLKNEDSDSKTKLEIFPNLNKDGEPAMEGDGSGMKLGKGRGKIKKPQPLQKCRLCDCIFPRRSQLRAHVRSSHADRMKYLCAWCGARYLSASGHHSHLKICNKKPKQEADKEQERKEQAAPRRPRCPGQTLLHGPGPFICEVCGKVLKTYGSWRTHMDAHSGRRRIFTCPHCPFRSSSNGMAHSHRLRHAGLKPYACDVCPFRTDARQSLMMHARMHAGDLRHACRLCDFRAICVTNLKRHMASKHSQEKPFQCPQCDKSYFDKLNLSDHVACKHEGVKPHACHVCAVQMSSLKAKQRHYRKFHPQEPKPTRERPLSSH